jgi:arylsulfatase A-like enzyme
VEWRRKKVCDDYGTATASLATRKGFTMKSLVTSYSLSLVLTVTALLTASTSAAAEGKADRPNVLIILADDLGENDLGCYGRKDQHTPHLDQLAAEGMRFTSFYCAQPICSPSRAALLTSKTPARLHLTNYLPGRPDTRSQPLLQPKIRQELPLEEQTLAEVLKKAGYATACIGKWHLGGKGLGPGQHGFDVVFAGRANTKPSATEGGKGEYELTAHAKAFLTAHRDQPFFLYLAHNNPHIPLAAKPELVAKNRIAFNPLYAAVVETLDESVGRLLAHVDSLGLHDRTMVIFTSDNGGLHVPELGDDPPTYNAPFRAGKGFLYEGGLRVPLLVRWPGRIRAGTVTGVPVVNTDLMPTLLELLGLELPPGLDGVSYARLLRGTGELPSRTLFWHFPHYTNQGGRPAGAVREGDWKLIEHYEDGRLELFNLARDPGETHDLSAEQPQRTASLKEKLAAWRKAVGAQECTPNPDFDPKLYKQLYVDTDVSRLKPTTTAAEMTPQLAAWRKGIDAVVRTGRVGR